MDIKQAIERCHKAALQLGFDHPHFLLAHARIRGLYREAPKDLDTMGVDDRGRIMVSPAFVESLPMPQLAGCLAHEMCHLLLDHHARRGDRIPLVWNVAGDMIINTALTADGIQLPPGGCAMPPNYQGDLTTEAVYDWLLKNKTQIIEVPADGPPKIGQGCGVSDSGDGPGDGDGASAGPGSVAEVTGPGGWAQVAREVRAQAQMAGFGSSRVAAMLSPKQPKVDWRRVIRHGFQVAYDAQHKDWQTYARRNRRSPPRGAQFPGWAGTNPSVAVAIDVSGSMDREWVSQIVAETKRLLTTFPGAKCFLVSHTDRVTWRGWLVPREPTDGKLLEAVSHSGGTDPDPAYEEVGRAGTFDALVHFTDCEFMRGWPVSPTRRLIVGAFGGGAHGRGTPPPPGAEVIPCEK